MSKKRFLIGSLITGIFLTVFLGGVSFADWCTTVNATPNPALVQQDVEISITASYGFSSNPDCQISVDFGDSRMETISATSCSGAEIARTCRMMLKHKYSKSGIFKVKLYPENTQSCNPVRSICVSPSASSETSVEIVSPLKITSPSPLPDGVYGTHEEIGLRGEATAGGSADLQAGPKVTVQNTYEYQLQTSGGKAPVTFSLLSGSLPSGLTLSSGGKISGTLKSHGTYTFTVRAKDSLTTVNNSDTKEFTLLVRRAPSVADKLPAKPSMPTGIPKLPGR